MRDTRGRIAVAGALAWLVAGCSVMAPRSPQAPEPPRSSRAAREREINDAWQNQTVRDLIARWGPPRLLLDIPGGGNPPGFVLVYRRDEGSGCLDTFAVMYGDVTRVRTYQCR